MAAYSTDEYQTIEEDEAEEYFEDGIPSDFVFTENIKLGETSDLGYLLNLQDGQVTIQTAQFYLDATGGAGPCWTHHLTAYSSIKVLEFYNIKSGYL